MVVWDMSEELLFVNQLHCPSLQKLHRRCTATANIGESQKPFAKFLVTAAQKWTKLRFALNA